MATLRAGVAKSKFAVPVGFKMGGYDDRKSGNTGNHDSLYTKSLALNDGENTILIITNDLLSVDGEMTADIRKSISRQTGIPGHHVMACASHTHSGPDLNTADLMGMGSNEEASLLKKEITQTIAENALNSLEHMRLAELYFGKSVCSKIAANRIDPALPSDHSVSALQLVDDKKETIAVLINYACHPTVLGPDNLLISADFPGAAERILEQHFGGKAVALFTNGACGDQSTRFTRKGQDFDEVERMGSLLAKSAIEAMDNAVLCSDVKLQAASRIVELPARKLPSIEEALKQLKEAEELKDKAFAEKRCLSEIRLAYTRFQGAYITLKMIESEKLNKNISGEIQILKASDIVFIGLPVELFAEYGLSIKQKTRSKNTIIIGYANDYLGYVYTQKEAHKGGYEAWASPFAPEAGITLVEQVLSLEDKIY